MHQPSDFDVLEAYASDRRLRLDFFPCQPAAKEGKEGSAVVSALVKFVEISAMRDQGMLRKTSHVVSEVFLRLGLELYPTKTRRRREWGFRYPLNVTVFWYHKEL